MQNITFYVSSNGLYANDGLTPETPWYWDWFGVSSTIRKKNASYKDVTIIFLEGDYYIDEYGIIVN